MDISGPPLSGRKAQAARNDELILAAARAVFIADPGAPIAAVAERAGVGISALYRRYASKEILLQHLCGDGLRRYIDAVEAALAVTDDPWGSFVQFMNDCLDSETSSLTVRLAGTFTPTEELFHQSAHASELTVRLFERTVADGCLRPGISVSDVAMLQEQLTAINIGDERRTNQLRHRYLALMLDALHVPSGAGELPGPPPAEEELVQRWIRN